MSESIYKTTVNGVNITVHVPADIKNKDAYAQAHIEAIVKDYSIVEPKKAALTEKEVQVLQAIDGSEFGNYLSDDVWTWSVTDAVAFDSRGVISSLVKKGFVRADGRGRDMTIGMTYEGYRAYIQRCVPRKEHGFKLN